MTERDERGSTPAAQPLNIGLIIEKMRQLSERLGDEDDLSELSALADHLEALQGVSATGETPRCPVCPHCALRAAEPPAERTEADEQFVRDITAECSDGLVECGKGFNANMAVRFRAIIKIAEARLAARGKETKA